MMIYRPGKDHSPKTLLSKDPDATNVPYTILLQGNLPNDMVSKLAGTSNANGNEINQVHNIVRTDDIPNEATKVNESKGGIGLNDVLTGIDNVDMFSKVNTVVFSITDDVGMLYYLKKMFFSFVNSSSLMLTMQRDRS